MKGNILELNNYSSNGHSIKYIFLNMSHEKELKKLSFKESNTKTCWSTYGLNERSRFKLMNNST